MNKSLPGKYLLRRADDVLQQPGLQIAPKGSEYQGYVNFPTTYGTMLIRILVKYNNTENLKIVHKYQSEYAINPIARVTTQSNTPAVPNVKKIFANGTRTISTASDILTLLAQVASFNQPELYSERYSVASILGLAGLVNGTYTTPPEVDLDSAFAAANAAINTTITSPANVNNVGNDWQLAYPSAEGNFGTNYASRANVAQTGYQQLVPYITLYPGYKGASFSTFTLAPSQSLLFTFSGRPPIHPLGFWSLTVYGADQYLVPNTLNRFEVGDRSNLTFNDGTPVYNDEKPTGEDAEFKVLMQPADIAPPANWTSNWLPAPAGGGPLSFIMRWYVPSLALSNGSYVYPTVEAIPAIKA